MLVNYDYVLINNNILCNIIEIENTKVKMFDELIKNLISLWTLYGNRFNYKFSIE